jgi:ParB-like chromosome segregation protein Spo0J
MVGWVATVVVNERTGYVVDGHARIEEALSKHEKTVPVLYVDLTEEEERLVLASLDPIGAMAERDQERLDELLEDLHVDDVGLQALLDSLGTPGEKDPEKPPAESPTDEVTCPECGATFNIGVRVKPSPGGPRGDEMAGGN